MTFVDSNVILDVVTGDPRHLDWSKNALAMRDLQGPLIVNDIVFAELCGRAASVEAAGEILRAGGFSHLAIPRSALFRAAYAYRLYRSRKGLRTGVLPDFFIGAHAEILGCPLLTRDTLRYRRYFPNVELIAPEPIH